MTSSLGWTMVLALAAGTADPAAPRTRPTLDELMGLNVHTVQFRPELYAPVARHLRNYHPAEWDLGRETGHRTTFPFARNGVDWSTLYGAWRKRGYSVAASVMFETLPPAAWADRAADAEAYGAAFGAYFGPTGWLDAVEVGNEPGEFSDPAYTAFFDAFTRGLRRTAPRLPIATCAVRVEPSGRWHKDIETVRPHLDRVDVISVHTYAEAEPWPTFRRSFPEDPDVRFLQPVREVMAWRDRHAPGRKVWVTEFGWDAASRAPDPAGEWARWVGQTETDQARWIVRAWLEFARMGVDRAYQFWFNDDDSPSMHGASGLTRRYEPKPAFHAAVHLRAALGGYRWSRDVRRNREVHAMEFVRADDPRDVAWAVWTPTRDGAPLEVEMPGWRGTVVRAERLALTAGEPPAATVRAERDRLSLTADGSPVFIFGRR